MADLDAIRQALATTLATVTTISVTADYHSQVNPPQAVIFPQPGQEIQFVTMDGAVDYLLSVVLLQPWLDETAAQEAMDALLDAGPGVSPASSVLACLRADPTLGGAASWAIPTSVHGYRISEWGGLPVLRADLLVQVGALGIWYGKARR